MGGHSYPPAGNTASMIVPLVVVVAAGSGTEIAGEGGPSDNDDNDGGCGTAVDGGGGRTDGM